MLKHLDRPGAWRWLFGFCIAVNLTLSLVGIGHSLEEVHVFRQIQTALTTQRLLDDGWQLAYPTPLFGPPWSVPMEFPLYELLVAAVCWLTPVPLEAAGRLVSLAALYAAFPALFGLMRLMRVPAERRWLLPALMLFSPAYAYYSRTFMIESTALCAAVWFIYGYAQALETRSTRWLWAAALAGVAAALAKVTTCIVFFAVAAIWSVWKFSAVWRAGARARDLSALLGRALAATVPAAVAGTWWVHFSDAVKASNPLSAHLTSTAMRPFNFGTLAQRGSGEFWHRIYEHTLGTTMASINLGLIVLFVLILGRGYRWRTLLLIAGFAAGPLVFANLYFVHDYYFYATGLFMLGALVMAWNQLLDLETFSAGARYTTIALSLALQLGTYLDGYFRVQLKPLAPPPELGQVLGAGTRPGDVVLVFGHDWSSSLAYYAHRRTIMVTDRLANEPDKVHGVLDRLPARSVTALVVSGQLKTYPDYIRPFVARLGLTPSATLLGPDTAVYFAPDRLPQLYDALEHRSLTSLKLAEPPDEGTPGVPRLRVIGADLKDPTLTSMMSNKPVAVLYPFGLFAHVINGRRAFDAHAPTDVIFQVPRDARTVQVEFGILEGAYTGTNHTNGVEFRLELVTPAGARRQLYNTILDPSNRAGDRGSKSATVALPPGAAGELWCRTLPGADNNLAWDWAYWSRIDFR